MYKIIISDDEIMVCKVLEKILYENVPGVQILPPAANGIELISSVESEVPDIAIVDINMPEMNGLDACEIIKVRHPELKILVVSAYSEFEYAQKSILLGTSGYILKPFRPETVLSTVRKLCGQIDQERKKLDEKHEMAEILKDYHDTVEHEFMSNLLLGDVPEASWQKYQNLLPHPFYGAFLVCVHARGEEASGTDRIYGEFLRGMKKICTCSGRVNKKRLFLCVFPAIADTKEHYQQWVLSDLECVCETLWEEVVYSVGISDFKQELDDLPQGIRESQAVLLYHVGSGVSFWKMDKEKIKSNVLFEGQETCRRLAQAHQYDLLGQVLEESAGQFQKWGDLRLFQIFLLDLLHEIFKDVRTISGQGRYPLFISWIYWKKILGQKDYGQLLIAFRGILERLRNGEMQVYHPYIVDSLDYIREHYREDLTLEALAAQINISSFYLSRLFKQELDYTFLETLTDMRLSEALTLLYEGYFSTREIGEKCGYQNTSYFYKLFKKQTGMTIRDMRGKILEERSYAKDMPPA